LKVIISLAWGKKREKKPHTLAQNMLRLSEKSMIALTKKSIVLRAEENTSKPF